MLGSRHRPASRPPFPEPPVAWAPMHGRGGAHPQGPQLSGSRRSGSRRGRLGRFPGWGRARRLPLPVQARAHCSPARGRAVRPEDRANGYGKEARTALQVAPPCSLKFAAGEGIDSVLPLQPAPRGLAGSTRAPLTLGGSGGHSPRGSRPARVPDPLSGLHPSWCPRPPPPPQPAPSPQRWISDET